MVQECVALQNRQLLPFQSDPQRMNSPVYAEDLCTLEGTCAWQDKVFQPSTHHGRSQLQRRKSNPPNNKGIHVDKQNPRNEELTHENPVVERQDQNA